MISPPTISLQPGSQNTAAVKQLQDWLVSIGMMTQAQVNTGYGTYGPQTTQAVLQYQQKLGVDNSTGPGYWGPRTISAYQTAIQNKATPPTALAVQPKVGNQYTLSSAALDVGQNLASMGQPLTSFTDALSAAQKDPDIIAKYSDIAKLDKQSFNQQLQTAQTLYSNQAQQQQLQFEKDRKGLAEQQAAAGTAYSGFRGKAQADLAQTESGIVSSSRAQQQQALNELTSQFEGKYGTGATPSAQLTLQNPLTGNTSASGLQQTGGGTQTLTGEQAGGIIGTVAPQQQAETNQQALYNYTTAQTPSGLGTASAPPTTTIATTPTATAPTQTATPRDYSPLRPGELITDYYKRIGIAGY